MEPDKTNFSVPRRRSVQYGGLNSPMDRSASKKSSSKDRNGIVYPGSFKETGIRRVTPDPNTENIPAAVETVNLSRNTNASPGSSVRSQVPETRRRPDLSTFNPEREEEDSQSDAKSYRTRSRTTAFDSQRSEVSPNLSRGRNRFGSVNTTASHAKNPDDLITSIGYPSIQSYTLASQLSNTSTTPTYVSQAASRPRLDKSPPLVQSGVANNQAAFVSPLSYSDSSKILELMKATCGRMHGILSFRNSPSASWTLGYCAINVASGSLIYQAKGEPALAKNLVPDLRGCKVRTLFDTESQTTYLSVSTFASGLAIQLRPHIGETFDSWLAALLCWQPIRPRGVQNKMTKPQSLAIPERHLAGRRRGSESSTQKDAAVIKVGRMLLWDKPSASGAWPAAGRRVSTYRQQRALSSSWKKVSCILQENGHFKLFNESDVTPLNTIYLSQLSRCAVQPLHPSVLEDEFCIAIYPQYAVHSTIYEYSTRPIYIALESRVLFEVWFVLLRAFTVPELYGPQTPLEDFPGDPSLSASTHGMFRIERLLDVKVTEARLCRKEDTRKGKKYPKSLVSTAPVPAVSDYYTEVLLDGEIGAKTAVKYRTANPFWRENFSFNDLSPVLSQVTILLKTLNTTQKDWSLISHGSYAVNKENNSIQTLDDIEISSHDVTFGKVDFRLDDLQPGVEVEKWWPILDDRDQPVGEMFMKVRLEETVVLVSKEYESLSELLHSFSNGLTVQMSQFLPSELTKLSETLLNIFQVSGQAREWISSLVEDEIDGVHKESTTNRIRYNSRIHSNDSRESNKEREVLVRDLGRTATVEANLLFRGNSILTKALDLHMRRLGKEYLEETIGERVHDIDETEPECEVDPSRVPRADDLERNWRALVSLTTEVWKSIASSASRCPPELRLIFRHVRACAEDRYGDFLRTVTYSSVSGFLFLRFFCPAILNPKLFGLLKDHPRPQAQRTLTLVAKALQGLANMSTFGNKEPWMEPMNRFLVCHRSEFKDFVDEICAIPADRPVSTVTPSYATPFQILSRLPSIAREGFPSLPFLIDQARNFAILVHVWLEGAPNILAESDGYDSDIVKFHNLALRIQQRTMKCLSAAEQAERPSGDLEVKWEELLESMERCATFYDDEGCLDKPSGPPAESSANAKPPSVAGNQRSSVFGSRLPLTRRSTDCAQDADGDTPPNSSSANWDQNRVTFTMPRWSEPRESTGSSKNSSTYSFDYSDSSKGRRSSMSKENSSKYRLFDWGSSRRKCKDRDHYQSAPA